MSNDREPLPALDYQRRARPRGGDRPTIGDRLAWVAGCVSVAVALVGVLRVCVTTFALGSTATALLFAVFFVAWSYAAVMSGFQLGERRARIRARQATRDRRGS